MEGEERVHLYDGPWRLACSPDRVFGRWITKDVELVTCKQCLLVFRKRTLEDVINVRHSHRHRESTCTRSERRVHG